MKSIIVIHHSADFDGLFCREIAKRFFGDRADYIGWDYGQSLPELSPDGHELYMLDISVDGLMDYPGLVWIDHHKSAMDKYSPAIKGYRIDGVAACRLAYQWFFTATCARNPMIDSSQILPMKGEFVARTVQEPLAVRLAGEYDIWDKRDPRVDLFQHGLRSRDLTNDWPALLSLGNPPTKEEKEAWDNMSMELAIEPDGTTVPGVVAGLLAGGQVLQYSQTQANASLAQEVAFDLEWEGLKFLALNKPRANSMTFLAGLRPDHDACLSFYWLKNKWRLSFYHAPGKEHHDLSKIAVKYGGGGHRGACGCEAKVLPFSL